MVVGRQPGTQLEKQLEKEISDQVKAPGTEGDLIEKHGNNATQNKEDER